MKREEASTPGAGPTLTGPARLSPQAPVERLLQDPSPFAFHQAVRLQLEVGEHDLGVKRAGDTVDGMLQQHHAFIATAGTLEHQVEKQRLAQRRRYFRHKDRVAGIDERLRLVRQQRVHRVAHLVGQREHRVERLVVVEQHVGMRPVHRRRVRPTAFADVLEDVDPPSVEGLSDVSLVLRTERGDGVAGLPGERMHGDRLQVDAGEDQQARVQVEKGVGHDGGADVAGLLVGEGKNDREGDERRKAREHGHEEPRRRARAVAARGRRPARRPAAAAPAAARWRAARGATAAPLDPVDRAAIDGCLTDV